MVCDDHNPSDKPACLGIEKRTVSKLSRGKWTRSYIRCARPCFTHLLPGFASIFCVEDGQVLFWIYGILAFLSHIHSPTILFIHKGNLRCLSWYRKFLPGFASIYGAYEWCPRCIKTRSWYNPGRCLIEKKRSNETCIWCWKMDLIPGLATIYCMDENTLREISIS